MVSLENCTKLEFSYGIKSFPNFVTDHAKSDPNRIALIYYGRKITFKELDDCSRSLATAITGLGYQKGERMAVLLQSCPQCVIAYLAGLQLGLIIVPIDPMAKGFELDHYLNDSGATLLITMDSLYGLVQSLENKASVKNIIVTAFQDFLQEEPLLPLPPLMQDPVVSCDGALQLMELISTSKPSEPPEKVELDDTAFIFYTGGTTGLSKGCVHTQRDLLYTATGQAVYNNLEPVPEDIALQILPITHISGTTSVVLNLMVGSCILLLSRWDVKAALAAQRNFRITNMAIPVPCYWDILLNMDPDNDDFSSVKSSVMVPFGMEITQEIIDKWGALAPDMEIFDWGYGSSEHANYCGGGYGLGFPRPECVTRARLLPEVAVSIRDFVTGEELPDGKIGEIVTKTPAQLKFYWNRPDQTQKTIVDGWVHMNDRGYIKDGILYFMGKASDVVKVSGYTVSLPEIEQFGLKNEHINQIAVVGVPHPRKGTTLKAFVTLVKPDSIAAPELEQWFKENVSAFKVPAVEIRDKLPETGAGKILKRVLLEEEISKTS